jgi:hypothetical protein
MRIAPLIDNPLNGILPNFSIFGVQFTQLWQKLLGGVWGIALVAAVAFLILGLASMAAASRGGNPNELILARRNTIWAGITLGLLAALAVIVGGILAVFG